MKEDCLTGTVKPYQRHLFICTPGDDWPARIESGAGFLAAFSKAVEARSSEISGKVKVTACHGEITHNGHDVLLFPDQLRYSNLAETDIAMLVEDQLVGNQVSRRLSPTALGGRHVFVCTHGRRDLRCGECGPELVRSLSEEVEKRGLSDTIRVYRTSHVGGHRFAGNVLIYPGGDWYGYVSPSDVARLVECHILAGEVVHDLWRGRMGLSQEEQVRMAGG